MNYPEFMTAITDVYGEYQSDILKKMTAKYIKERWKETELETVFKKLILVKTAKYKTPPDPAEFEEIFFSKSDKDLEAEALKWWRELDNKSSYMKDCIISDIRVQTALNDMGGWIWFSTRMIKDDSGRDIDVWNQKRFIELFKMYTANPPDGEIRLLRGESTFPEEKRKAQTIMIGDPDACRLALSYKTENIMRIANDMTKEMRAEV